MFETLKHLKKEGDKLEMEGVFIGLSLVEEKALRYVVDENNDCVDKFSKLLSNGEHKKLKPSWTI